MCSHQILSAPRTTLSPPWDSIYLKHRLCRFTLGSFGSPLFGAPLSNSGCRKRIAQARSPKPEARSPKPEARSLKPEARSRPSRRNLPPPPQQLLQHADPFIHMLLLQEKRRQEAHHGVLRAVEKNSLRQRSIHNW